MRLYTSYFGRRETPFAKRTPFVRFVKHRTASKSIRDFLGRSVWVVVLVATATPGSSTATWQSTWLKSPKLVTSMAPRWSSPNMAPAVLRIGNVILQFIPIQSPVNLLISTCDREEGCTTCRLGDTETRDQLLQRAGAINLLPCTVHVCWAF